MVFTWIDLIGNLFTNWHSPFQTRNTLILMFDGDGVQQPPVWPYGTLSNKHFFHCTLHFDQVVDCLSVFFSGLKRNDAPAPAFQTSHPGSHTLTAGGFLSYRCSKKLHPRGVYDSNANITSSTPCHGGKIGSKCVRHAWCGGGGFGHAWNT